MWTERCILSFEQTTRQIWALLLQVLAGDKLELQKFEKGRKRFVSINLGLKFSH